MPGTGEWKKWEDVGQRMHIFSYKMNKFWGSNVQYGKYSQWYILYSKSAKKVDLKYSHHIHTNTNTHETVTMGSAGRAISWIVVIIL